MLIFLVCLAFAGPVAWAADPSRQTIVLLRHGEKPPAGLGQLDCQGLNRALALPPVLARLFGAEPRYLTTPDDVHYILELAAN